MMTSLWAGLVVGSVYAAIAIGYNITLVTAGVLNFAFANLLVLGAFVAISLLAWGWPVPLVLLGAAVVCAAIAMLEERIAIRPLPAGGHAELVTTLGAATVLTGATAVVWGSDPQRIELFTQRPISLLGGQVAPSGLALVAAVLLLGGGLQLFLQNSRHGLASVAHARDREATMLRGVDVRWLSLAAFGVAGVVAGLLGPLAAMTTTASPFIALVLAVKGFIALTLGGIGSQGGAVAGGLLIGLAEAVSNLWLGPLYGDFVVFAIFVAILATRPRGIFGLKVARAV